MKQHPFFEGIDFKEVSKKNYKGLFPMVSKLIPKKTEISNEPDNRYSVGNVDGMSSNPLMHENEVVMRGNLCKKNWYGNKQVRFFEIYRYGELKYYKDFKDYKGSITLGPDSKIIKNGRTTVKVFCEKKKKDYILMQPESNQVSFADEKKKGYHSFIDDWVKEMNNVVDYLKAKEKNGQANVF